MTRKQAHLAASGNDVPQKAVTQTEASPLVPVNYIVGGSVGGGDSRISTCRLESFIHTYTHGARRERSLRYRRLLGLLNEARGLLAVDQAADFVAQG